MSNTAGKSFVFANILRTKVAVFNSNALSNSKIPKRFYYRATYEGNAPDKSVLNEVRFI